VPAAGAPAPEAVWDQLKKVYDPEIPVNIVDLGLVYSMDVEKVDAGYRVNVSMTLTAPGCGMGPAIAEDARGKILQVPGISSAEVRLVWEPPWNQSMISEEGKMRLAWSEAVGLGSRRAKTPVRRPTLRLTPAAFARWCRSLVTRGVSTRKLRPYPSNLIRIIPAKESSTVDRGAGCVGPAPAVSAPGPIPCRHVQRRTLLRHSRPDPRPHAAGAQHHEFTS